MKKKKEIHKSLLILIFWYRTKEKIKKNKRKTEKEKTRGKDCLLILQFRKAIPG